MRTSIGPPPCSGSSTRRRYRPHFANQLSTGAELLLVDGEMFAAAPPERDLASLPLAERHALGADPEMLELFELEWMLSEMEEYSRWFSAPHTGTQDDRLALHGLQQELEG